MCQKSTCFVRGIFVDIRRGYRKIPNFVPSEEVAKWQWLIVSMGHLFEIYEETVVYAYRIASNFKPEEPRCFYGNSIRFSDEKCCRV